MEMPSLETMTIIAGCFTAFLSFLSFVGGGLYWLFSTIFTWVTTHINPVIADHRKLVGTLNTEVPKVSETLCALKETQIQQCKQLDAHGERMERHDAKLDNILSEIRKSNPSISSVPKETK